MAYLFPLDFLIYIMTLYFNQANHIDQENLSAIFSYSDNSINLTLTNNSDTPVYLLTNIDQNIEIYYKGKKIKDIDILYNHDDFPPLPAPPKYDSTFMKNQLIGTYINCENIKMFDSVLFDYMLNEYEKLNKVIDINPEDKQTIKTYMHLSMGTERFLFLDPNESFTFNNQYSCFKRLAGNYIVKAKSRGKKYLFKSFKIREENGNKVYKIPLIRPPELIGYKRYDDPIKPKIYSILIKDNP